MAFALTKAVAYGIEAEEAVNKRYKQVLQLTITAANTDTALDLGDYAGTFWDAVDGSTPGDEALAAIKSINTKAAQLIKVASEPLLSRQVIDPTTTKELSFLSAASSGGAAEESFTVTGLKTTDTIISVDMEVDGAGTGKSIVAYDQPADADDDLDVTFDADPGANAKVRVLVQRTETTSAPEAGQFGLAMNGTNARLPDITWNSGDAPTSYIVHLEWILKDAEVPTELSAVAA